VNPKGNMKIVPPVRLKLITPAENHIHSRGFYQEEEESLYVPLYPGGRFFSYLDGDNIRLDIDNKGRLLFLSLNIPRRRWIKVPRLRFPAVPGSASMKIINFRDRLPRARIYSSLNIQNLHISLFKEPVENTYQLTPSLLIETGTNNNLTGFWIKGVEEDRAALKMAAWRKHMKDEQEKNVPVYKREPYSGRREQAEKKRRSY